MAFETQAAIDLHGVHEQFKIFEAARVAGEINTDARKSERVCIQHLINVEHHAHQRQAARVAFERKIFEQRTKGDLLMFIGIKQHTLRGRDQVTRRCCRIHRDAQR